MICKEKKALFWNALNIFLQIIPAGQASSMPFMVSDLVPMVIVLRDICLGIIELAYPDARPTLNDDYRHALTKTGVKARNNNVKEVSRQTVQWAYLFKVNVWIMIFSF